MNSKSTNDIIESFKTIGYSSGTLKSENDKLIFEQKKWIIYLIIVGFLVAPTLSSVFFKVSLSFIHQLLCYGIAVVLFVLKILKNPTVIIDLRSKVVVNKSLVSQKSLTQEQIKDYTVKSYSRKGQTVYVMYVNDDKGTELKVAHTSGMLIKEDVDSFAESFFQFIKN